MRAPDCCRYCGAPWPHDGACCPDCRHPLIDWQAAVQPVGWKRARSNGRQRFTDPIEQAYRDELLFRWMQARARGRIPKMPPAVPLAVRFTFAGSSTGRRRQPDLSNLIKAVEDAGNGILWHDDRLIRGYEGPTCIEAWGPDVAPFLRVEVWPW